MQYEIVEGCSQRGNPKLMDNIGFDYNLKSSSSRGTNWVCTKRHRSKKKDGSVHSIYCPAAVFQKGDSFQRNSFPHIHAPEPGKLQAHRLKARAVEQGLSRKFESANAIVNEVYQVRIICLAVLQRRNWI